MKIATRLTLGLVLSTALLVAAVWTGRHSVDSLVETLDFVTGPAWDAADGAMEASISIGNQMLLVEKMTEQRHGPEEMRALRRALEEAEKFGREALERLHGSGLFSAEERRALDDRLAAYGRLREGIVESARDFYVAREELEKGFFDFQEFMTALEEFGDGQVESLEQSPDLALSWNGGLRERWQVADGAMEAQIRLLETYYNLQGLLSLTGAPEPARETRIRTALEAATAGLRQRCRDLLGLSSLQRPQVGVPGETLSTVLRGHLADHARLFASCVTRFETFRTARRRYREAAEGFLTFLVPFEETGDGKVEGQRKVIQLRKEQAVQSLFWMLVLGLALSAATALMVFRSVTQPLGAVSVAIETFSQRGGELDLAESGGDDEIGSLVTSIRAMVSKLGDRERNLRAMTRQLNEAGGELQRESSSQTTLTRQQADAVRQTATAATELRTLAKQFTEVAEEVHRSGLASTAASDEGMRANDSAQAAVNRLEGCVDEIRDTLGKLSTRTEQIGEILAAVNELAEQSKLLALNAAIEAARAGEHGKGFGVVSLEVRNLAQQSQDATRQIKVIITELHQAMEMTSRSVGDGRTEARGAVQILEESRKAIRTLSEVIRSSQEGANRILKAANQQDVGIEQIAEAMHEIEETVGQTIETAERVSSVADRLRQAGEEIDGLLG